MIGADILSIAPRTYPDIVRDVLTLLTQGVANEQHTVDYDPFARPLVIEVVLQRRPVRRVSSVSGLVAGPPGGPELVPHTFGLDEYALIGDPDDPDDVHTVQFRPFAVNKPAPGTDVVVNYYPRSTDPSPITDVTVGSVARTLLEAIAHEVAVLYGQLEQAYDAAFVGTATGSSLERVVALLGYSRYRAGRPVGTVRFGRRPGATGVIVIPAGTPVTDLQNTVRYDTTETRTMLAGESTAEVRVRAATDSTAVVDAGGLAVVQRAIAGIDTVTNERPTSAASGDETDEELRARARVALLASNKGTVPAIRNGLLALPDVRAVAVEEFPNGVPGELRVTISLADGGDELPPAVVDKLEELRPAGVRLLPPRTTSPADISVLIQLTLAGSTLPATEVEGLHRRIQRDLAALAGRTGVGQKLRAAQVVSTVLADERVVDAVVTLGAKGGAPGSPGADFQAPEGTIVVLEPDDITFATDRFEQAPPDGSATVAVTVQATIVAAPVGGTTADEVRRRLTDKLTALVQTLRPGTRVDADVALAALRDDARYQIDPLKLRVVFTLGDQFVEVAQGGPAFTAQPSQTFTVSGVEVGDG
ncbi:MAG: hypothetical protein QOI56_861 [Actinomycetota bacterium]|nr:hypothetical protein [Actinomycetota bacterium]